MVASDAYKNFIGLPLFSYGADCKFLLGVKGAAKASLQIQSVALVKVQGTKPPEVLKFQAK